MTQLFRALMLGLTLTAMLAGCASYSPSRDDVGNDLVSITKKMGQPTQALKTASGTRLVYARGPYGRHTYFLEFDADDRLIGFDQVLTEERFRKVAVDMTMEEVENLIGPSFEKRGLARERGSVWAYRFQTPFCTWFEIEFTAQGRVRSSGYGFPPECLRGSWGGFGGFFFFP